MAFPFFVYHQSILEKKFSLLRQAWPPSFRMSYSVKANLRCGFRVLDYCDVDSGKWLAYARLKAFPLSFGHPPRLSPVRQHYIRCQLFLTFPLVLCP